MLSLLCGRARRPARLPRTGYRRRITAVRKRGTLEHTLRDPHLCSRCRQSPRQHCHASFFVADCVGDQLTGTSSADAYRRQLLQGCRQLEVDFWDGKYSPMITHGESAGDPDRGARLDVRSFTACCVPGCLGHTFCTVERFPEVARAISQCAFIVSELPVRAPFPIHFEAHLWHLTLSHTAFVSRLPI